MTPEGMKLKAKFVGRYAWNDWGQQRVLLEYEYRGRRYTVEENLSRGNIPLAWQHRNKQDDIDAAIEREEREAKSTQTGPTAQEAFDVWWDYIEGDEDAFNEMRAQFATKAQ